MKSEILPITVTWAVNSFAHLYGLRPYDRSIMPRENWIVAAMGIGEGWHNYHHAFPYDYRASELGWRWNLSCAFIDTCALFGLAYNLKTPTKASVDARRQRSGDARSANDRQSLLDRLDYSSRE